MIKKCMNVLIDNMLNESSASNLSKDVDLVIGSRSYGAIREGIDDLYSFHFDHEYRSRKFEKSIRSYKEALRKN